MTLLENDIVIESLAEQLHKQFIDQVSAAFDKRPQTERELWEYCRDVGYTLAWQATTEGNQTPFELLSDLWFGRVDNVLVKATRRASKTTILALWDLLVSKFLIGCWTTHVGVIQNQANRGYRYLTDLLKNPWFAKDLAEPPRVSRTEWKNGSIVEVLTGTAKQMSGPSPQKLGVDEIDYWDMETFETALQMPTPKANIPTQICLLSTQYNARGLMSLLVPDIRDGRRDFKLYQWNEFDVLQRCPTCLKEQCALYRWVNPFTGEDEFLCKGRGLRGTGHISRVEAEKRFRTTGARTWAVQRLGMEPEESSLAFPPIAKNPSKYDLSLDTLIEKGAVRWVEMGVTEWGAPWGRYEIPTTWTVQIGNDWGYSQAGALLVVLRDPIGDYYIVDEVYGTHIVPDTWFEHAKRLDREWTQYITAGNTTIAKQPIIWTGHDRPGETYEWNAGGLRAFKRVEHRRSEALSHINNLLLDSQGQTQLSIDFERCENLQRTLRVLAIHKTLKDDLATNQEDHAYDAMRNVIMSWSIGVLLSSRAGVIV